MANAEQFRTALNRLLAEAQKVGRPFLELTAGELHRACRWISNTKSF